MVCPADRPTYLPSFAFSSYQVPAALLLCVGSGTIARMSQFPNSNQRRNAGAFIRVLEKVDPAATHGFGFQGRNYRSGSTIKIADLPNPAIALECASIVPPKLGPREPNHMLWVLWRFGYRENEWLEMARTSSSDWTWSLTLRPLAIRLLNPQPITFDCAEIARALTLSIEAELGKVPKEAQGDLLTRLDVHLAQQIARLQ